MDWHTQNSLLLARRQVVADRYPLALGYSILVLSYFQVQEGYGDHLASIFNASMSGYYCTGTARLKFAI